VLQTASYRLPRTAIPERYDLELEPDLPAATFAGRARVELTVVERTSEIVLNAAELEVTSAELLLPDGATRTPTIRIEEEEQRLILSFSDPLDPGAGYRLALSFTGLLNDKLRGFYRSTFTGLDGTEEVIATTQFEATDARRAFPCWDEPDFKAVFAVTLVVDEQLTAISNSAVLDDVPTGDGRRRIRFADTMVMSTYLVAFVVGPFAATDPLDVDGVPLRIVAPYGKESLTGFAIEVGSHALRFLSRYFELPYPGDKIDHVAVPDFAFGAMENLGCVTYRETALLIDDTTASQVELQTVATVVAHETAHMWFGDLVTMRWWNGIWLNEAFATFMELTTTDDLRPDWDVWTAFGVKRAAAMATDGLRSTRPVEFEVGRPEDAEAMFDVLTYQKGGAVLRMLEQYLGPETFRKGIARYLDEHRWANTETTDLWDAIEAISGEPVRTTMDSWIFQGGHPVISVEAGPDGHSVTLSQQRFLYAGEAAGERWVVPVNLRFSVDGSVRQERLLLDEVETTIVLDGQLDWVVVNEGGWGFYRVRYTPDLLRRLSERLQQVCDPLERLSLIGDTWAAVVAGAQPLDDWLALVSGLGDEDDPDVWTATLSPLGLIDLMVSDEDRPVLQAFVRRVAAPTLARLGWDPIPGEPARHGIVRARLITALGTLGADPEVRAESAARLARHATDRSALAPDLLTAAVNVVTASGGRAAFETMQQRFRDATNPQDKVRYLYALGASQDPDCLVAALNLCLGNEVRSQDAPFLIGSIIASRAGGRLGWEWLELHWDEALARFPANTVARMLEGITSLVERDLAGRVHEFLAVHEPPVGGPRIAQLEERLDINVALAERIGIVAALALASPS
jgi:puromycin-sensitive aminopeptidase